MTEEQHRDYARGLLEQVEIEQDELTKTILLAEINVHHGIALKMQLEALKATAPSK